MITFRRSARAKRNPQAAAIRRERMAVARSKGTHTPEEWQALQDEFGHRCVRCELVGYHLDRDHIVPVYQGGSDAIDNLQPLCAWCNAGKGPETTNWVIYRRDHGFSGSVA